MGEKKTKKPVVIALANQKGGVGKTTTAINVASYLNQAGNNVLVVDLDPQANTTSGFGIRREQIQSSIYHSLFDPSLSANSILKTAHQVFVFPAITELAAAEVELVNLPRREYKLKELISGFGFDYILIDCPPSLGLLTINALTASDYVIIPVQAEYYALEGLGNLLNSMDMIKTGLNPDLDLLGIAVTMFDPRTTLSTQVVSELQKHFGEKVFSSHIPRNVRVAEAPSFGKPISEHDKWSKGGRAYKKLANEIHKRVDALSADK